jgi:hypothetical protein
MQVSVSKQVSVFMENQPGKLARILKVLRRSGVGIRALSIAEAGDFGIIRMIVDKADEASATLRNAGYIVSVTEVLVMEVGEMSELYSVARKLGEAGINIEYAYSYSEPSSGVKTKLVLRVREPKAAVEAISGSV